MALNNYLIFLAATLLMLLDQKCWAQNNVGVTAGGGSGYNYGRPEVNLGTNANQAAIQSKATTPALRPIVAAFPTGSTTAGGAGVPTFPVVPTAFGATPNAFGAPFGDAPRAGPSPTTVSGYGPNVAPAGAFGGTTPTGRGLAQRPLQQGQSRGDSIYRNNPGNIQLTAGGGTGLNADYEDGDFSAIPGVPGVNYPIYSEAPQTNFDCNQQPLPGYYADVEAQCQVFHICALNRTYSFLCPNGTIFSQEALVCVWWNQFDCAIAPELYPNNAFIYDYTNERTAAGNAGYGPGATQSGTRQPGNFPLNTSGGRPSTANIFGATANIRPGIGGTPFSPVTTVQTGFPNNAGAAQNFPTPATASLPFGAVLRTGGDRGAERAGPAFGNIQDASFTNTNAAVASSATNREYLPPRRP